jgi:hypothetical protein
MWKSINVGLVAAVVAGSTAVAGEAIDSNAYPPGVGQTAKGVAGTALHEFFSNLLQYRR